MYTNHTLLTDGGGRGERYPARRGGGGLESVKLKRGVRCRRLEGSEDLCPGYWVVCLRLGSEEKKNLEDWGLSRGEEACKDSQH